MYLMFNEAIKYELISEIIHKSTYELVYTDKNGASKSTTLATTNQYLEGNYKAPDQVSVIGGKTGTTSAARNCLILLSKDISGNPYISVILSAKERGILYTEMTDLLEEIEN
jgi:D-alanyl-D-alanine carboxypeptidase